jgi:hypothetical protein
MSREQIETGLYRYAHRLVAQRIHSLTLREQVSLTIRDAERFAADAFETTLSHLRIVAVNVQDIVGMAARHALQAHMTGLGAGFKTIARS